MRHGRRHETSRGIALVLVMWVLSLLTVMALALTQIQRTEGALTANQLDGARFRAQATAVMNLVALDLMSAPAMTFESEATVWIPDGLARLYRFDGEEFLVTLSNEGSKFNLNDISREQLLALIDVVQGEEGQDEVLRDRVADAILDWRDEDDLSLVSGAEDADYQAEGLPYGARDGPFRSVEELGQVLGMPALIYDRLAPYLTVEDTGGQINEAFAAAPVLVAQNGYLLDEAQRIVDERSQGLFPDDPDSERTPLDRGGPRYHLRITRPKVRDRGPTMEALIRLDPGAATAFEILWQRFGSSRPAMPAAES